MSYYGFFEGCIKATEDMFEKLINTPRARAVQYEKEKQELINQIRISESYGEISHSEMRLLISKLKNIHFDEISKARAEAKRKKVKKNE